MSKIVHVLLYITSQHPLSYWGHLLEVGELWGHFSEMPLCCHAQGPVVWGWKPNMDPQPAPEGPLSRRQLYLGTDRTDSPTRDCEEKGKGKVMPQNAPAAASVPGRQSADLR